MTQFPSIWAMRKSHTHTHSFSLSLTYSLSLSLSLSPTSNIPIAHLYLISPPFTYHHRYNTAGSGTIPKTSVTIRHLLQHDAGFPPDPIPNYWDDTFGCPATANKPPRLDWR
eukprot:TRINITY_DN4019_c0_g1_i1.p1 TRINITY_DN4019_c0_g1~~TRINITY_DN4019_c0_g1_i1.p1  ORF type:complete len:112 (+),score=5.43 TRINITY_DN4019_c0_g1_i1:84-419(+)